MKKILLATTILALAGAAQAADLTVPYKNPATAGPVSDSGVFLTLEIGGSAGSGFTDFANIPGFATSFQPTGFLAGGALGWKTWLGKSVVFGLKADADYAWTNGGGNCMTPIGPGSCGISSHILMTQRAILAVPFFSTNAFIGVTGGAAERSLTANVLPVGSSNLWAGGWTAGGIVEAPLSPHMSLGVEVLYIDYSKTIAIGGSPVLAPLGANLGLQHEVVGKAGLNFHF